MPYKKKESNGLNFLSKQGIIKLIRDNFVVTEYHYTRKADRQKRISQWMHDIQSLHGIFAIVIVPE